MLLIEEKSLDEVYLLYQLSNFRDNFLVRFSIEFDIDILRCVRDLRKIFNEFHIQFPYGI